MNIRKVSLLLLPLLLMAGCNTKNPTKSSITDEDKVKPTSTSFDYTDFGSTEESGFDTSKWYKNTLKEMALPDPFVVEEDGTFYIYGTTDRTGARCFDCYETEDFNTFKLHKDIYAPSANSFTKQSLFAPEVYYLNGKYYMYYSGGNGVAPSAINVLVSDNADGPFREYVGENARGESVNFVTNPMLIDPKTPSLSILDQTLLVDGDDLYIFYSVYQTNVMQYIVGMKMLDPVTPDYDTYTILLRPGELSAKTTSTNMLEWECYQHFKVAEGPCVIKSPVNGKFYMTYSVNHYPDRFYTVCYAESDTPLGTYTKPYEKDSYWSNIFFGYAGAPQGRVYNEWGGFMSGTAHHSIFKAGNEYMIVYHAHKNFNDGARGVGFDHVYFDENGVPRTQGPSRSLQRLPEVVSEYKNIALNASVSVENVTHGERINDNFIVEHYNLPQEQDREVTLKAGKSYIKFTFDKPYKVGGIQIVNSAFGDKFLREVSFIKLGNGNDIIDSYFNEEEYTKASGENDTFIYPDSNITYEFNDVETSSIVFGFDNVEDVNINEIIILGAE